MPTSPACWRRATYTTQPSGTSNGRSTARRWRPIPTRCEDSIGCMHGSSEPDLRNWKSPPPQFTQGARPDEHP
ncbi:hypothetical protein CX042_15265 [Bordetella pertussis]|nr:hypothetical protein WU05_04420 [Bordetella pertussis]AQC40172.1 hypothetical protein WU39_15280 [Bordetella pertussis]ASR59665.1 hypothetical protein CBO47_15225 [Bordetella pertussis]ASR63251.1 hypothetical protein CBO46_14880 [Bordetella pertussis]ASR65032.1 hypothetical protein CBO48_04390 [Bordetella pertussis]